MHCCCRPPRLQGPRLSPLPLLAPLPTPPVHHYLQELERKGEAFAAERRKATDSILDLQRRLAEAESTAARLTAEHARLQEKLEAQRTAAEVRGACIAAAA